jgi:hypothetical protein
LTEVDSARNLASKPVAIVDRTISILLDAAMKPLPLVVSCVVAFCVAYGGLALWQPPKLAVFLVLFGLPLLLIIGRGLVAALQLLFH